MGTRNFNEENASDVCACQVFIFQSSACAQITTGCLNCAHQFFQPLFMWVSVTIRPLRKTNRLRRDEDVSELCVASASNSALAAVRNTTYWPEGCRMKQRREKRTGGRDKCKPKASPKMLRDGHSWNHKTPRAIFLESENDRHQIARTKIKKTRDPLT